MLSLDNGCSSTWDWATVTVLAQVYVPPTLRGPEPTCPHGDCSGHESGCIRPKTTAPVVIGRRRPSLWRRDHTHGTTPEQGVAARVIGGDGPGYPNVSGDAFAGAGKQPGQFHDPSGVA